jgi:hypothetical protein
LPPQVPSKTPKHPERNLESFKAFMSGDSNSTALHNYYRVKEMEAAGTLGNIVVTEKPASTFDKIISAIRADPESRQLAKIIPNETVKGGAINPDFAAFSEVLHHARIVSASLSQQESASHDLLPLLMKNSYQKNWPDSARRLEDFTIREGRQLRDAINGFSESVAIPELARKTRFLLTSGAITYKDMKDKVLTEVGKTLIGNRSLAVIYDLQRDWHGDRATLEATCRDPKYAREGKWDPLTADYPTANGYKITFKTTAAELETLGTEQHNCVGGYSSLCMSQPTHVGVVTKDKKVCSTFELSELQDRPVTLVQHVFKGNQPVGDADPEKQALEEYLGKLTSRQITFDSEKLAHSRHKALTQFNDISRICGFDPFYTEKPPPAARKKPRPSAKPSPCRNIARSSPAGATAAAKAPSPASSPAPAMPSCRAGARNGAAKPRKNSSAKPA